MKKVVFSIFAIFLVFIGLAFILPTLEDDIAVLHSLPPKTEVIESQASLKWVEEELKKMSLKEKIGQFFMVAAYSNKDEAHFKSLDSLILNEQIGGLIFFQGDRENLKTAISRFQSKSKIPLLVGMDAEWGVQMRLFGEDRFPYNYTIGAANDVKLTKKISVSSLST